MQLQISDAMNTLLERALRLSARQGCFYVGVEHLYCAVLERPEALPADFVEAFLNALMNAQRDLERLTWKGAADVPAGEMFHTPRCIKIIQQAGKLAAKRSGNAAEAKHLLLAILADALAVPSRALDAVGGDRGACIAMLLANIEATAAAPPLSSVATSAASKGAPEPAAKKQEAHRAAVAEAALGSASPAVAPLTRDLARLAEEGRLQPAVGRDAEIFEILQILTRKNKNNVMIVGEAGVGKTQVVEGLALMMARGGNSAVGLPSFRIFELNVAALLSGAQYRGAFEERLLSLLDQMKSTQDSVLFIEEAHQIMGAGAVEGGNLDMANLLKPALARGELRCIGATTVSEYRKFVERDPAIERRFQMVRLEELSEQESLKALARVAPSLEEHHGVRINEQAVKAAVQLSQRYMPNRCLPDKAIDILDQACARFRLKLMARGSGRKTGGAGTVVSVETGVTPHDIRRVVSQMTAIPIEEMTAEERRHLNRIERRIKKQLIGQDEAVAKTVAAVKKSRAGLADPKRPDAVLLFLGPSGVGKTQLAKLLATHLFGSPNHLITFDMSEYIEEHSVSRLLGAPPGYVGSEEEGRLTGAVRVSPYSILLFDEIEKAHPRIFDIFLPVFDEGRLKDTRGREASFRNCIIIMTSNIGADLLAHAGATDVRPRLIDELRRHFRPEFINRIDDIIPFYPLLGEDVRSILRLEIETIRERLQAQGIDLHVYQRAYQRLIEKGYRPEFGARELRRVVDAEITMPISERILKGAFAAGDIINVMEEEGRLVFRNARTVRAEGRATGEAPA